MHFARISKLIGEIEINEWSDLIARYEWLEPMPDRKMKNPFTGEEIIATGVGKAFFVQNGSRAGNASLEDGEILTTAIPASFCEELAACLSATVKEDDHS